MSDFSRLVHQHHALVFRVARSILRNDAAAEDATQDVYLRILRQPEALAAVQNPRAYLCRAASRRALEILREGARRARREEATVMKPRDPAPEEAAFRSEVREQVGCLPEDQRAAVSLHYFAGLSLAETAAALEIPQGTVASRVSGGLDRLRKALAVAAAPALLLMLESELRACEADAAVPSGIESRLLKLEAPGGASSTTSRRRIAGAVAAVMVVLIGLVVMRDRAAAREAAGTSGRTQPAAAVPAGAASAKDSAIEGAPPVAKEDAQVSRTIRVGSTGYGASGFLCRTDKALVLRAPRYSDEPVRDDFGLPDDLAPLAGLAATADASFGPFLAGGPIDGAPATWVECTVSETRVDDGERRRTVHVDRVEPLNPVWLAAWRDLVAAGAELDRLWLEAPGSARSSALAAASERLAAALRSARAARQGEAETGWRRMAESRAAAAHTDRLERAGLAAPFGPRATPAVLFDRFQSSRSGPEFKARLIADFGDDALAARIEWYWTIKESDGSSRIAPGVQEVRWLFVDTDAAFEAKRQDQAELRRRWEEQPPAPAPAVAGLTLESLPDADRAAFALDGGARVTAVAAGTPAETAGLRPGDLLWRVAGGEVPADAAAWAALLGKAQGDTELDVVRDGAVVRVRVAR